MKETVFSFKLRNHAGIQPDVIAAPLRAIKGVQDVTIGPGTLWTLDVRARFAGREEALRLHRKIISTLIKMEGITVAEATTQLSEVYGGWNAPA